MSYAYANSVLAIIRRRKFNRSSRSKPPRLRYAAIELRLYYSCAVTAPRLNFTACRDGDCSAGLASRTVPVSASKFCYNAPRKRPRRFDIVCRVGVRALWHREFVIARCANGYGADRRYVCRAMSICQMRVRRGLRSAGCVLRRSAPRLQSMSRPATCIVPHHASKRRPRKFKIL